MAITITTAITIDYDTRILENVAKTARHTGLMKSGLECHPNPSSISFPGGGESGVMNQIRTDSSVESKG